MIRKILLGLIIAVLLPLNGFAEEDEKEKDKLPLPRFVSLRSGEVNVRSGPGVRYPIKWVIMKDKMPMEVVAEFEDWRKIRDIQSDEGWVHKAMLSPRRMAMVKGKNKKIYSHPDEDSKVVAIGNSGVIVKLDKCDSKFCEIEKDSLDGFIKRSDIWGVYENEKIGK